MSEYNYGGVLNIPGFQVSQVFAYASVAQGPEYAWIWLNDDLWQGSEYARSTFHRALNKTPILNMPGLRIWEVGNKRGLQKVLNKPEYALISLNIP